jgi:hypothetical protein
VIPVGDIVRLVECPLDLSARPVVGRLVVLRAGTSGRTA